jgi:hypothetical protein
VVVLEVATGAVVAGAVVTGAPVVGGGAVVTVLWLEACVSVEHAASNTAANPHENTVEVARFTWITAQV